LAFPFPSSLGDTPLEYSSIVILLTYFYKHRDSLIILAFSGF